MPTIAYRAIESAARKLDIPGPYRHDEAAAITHAAAVNAKNSQPPNWMRRRFVVEQRNIGGSPVYLMRSKAAPIQRRILFLHGGGGMLRATRLHFQFATRLIMQTNAELWMPFYPLAPGPNFVDALDACMAAYREMLEDPTLPVSFAGDSAGANLELALCRQAIDAGLPQPDSIVCISPFTGFDKSNYQALFAAQARATRDPVLSVEIVDTICRHWYRDLPLDHHLGNPAFVDFRQFPPTLVLLGTAEICYPYTERIVAAMEAAQAPVRVERGEGLMHDWGLLNLFPEGARAQSLVKQFVIQHSTGISYPDYPTSHEHQRGV